MDMLQLRPVARRPAGLGLKPLKSTVPKTASYELRPLLPRISHSSAPLPAPGSVRGTMARGSCPPAPRTKARDEAEREPQQAPAAKQGEDKAAEAERKPAAPRQRSMAYRLFADVYACAYICSYRIGELIVVNAQEGLERLRRYVRDNFFSQRR